MAVGRCGVATLGKGVSEMQTRMLMAYWKVAVVLLDPGDADKEMETLALNLSRGLAGNVIHVKLQGYKDAGETPRQELWAQIGETAYRANIDLLKYNILI
jgi:hypothetical protein